MPQNASMYNMVFLFRTVSGQTFYQQPSSAPGVIHRFPARLILLQSSPAYDISCRCSTGHPPVPQYRSPHWAVRPAHYCRFPALPPLRVLPAEYSSSRSWKRKEQPLHPVPLPPADSPAAAPVHCVPLPDPFPSLPAHSGIFIRNLLSGTHIRSLIIFRNAQHCKINAALQADSFLCGLLMIDRYDSLTVQHLQYC